MEESSGKKKRANKAEVYVLSRKMFLLEGQNVYFFPFDPFVGHVRPDKAYFVAPPVFFHPFLETNTFSTKSPIMLRNSHVGKMLYCPL